MVKKIKRQDCLDEYQVSPRRIYNYKEDKEQFFYPKVLNSYILTLPSKSFKGHAKALGIELTKLTRAFHIDTLIFLGDSETPWLYQLNNYKPAREAQEYLRERRVGKRFNGGLQIDTAELPTFIKHLTWLSRCNGSLPDFYFTDKPQSMVGSICKYGNLHLDTINEQAENLLIAFLKDSKFEYGNQRSCYNRFKKSRVISHRQTIR
jgi:hypothetical protein